MTLPGWLRWTLILVVGGCSNTELGYLREKVAEQDRTITALRRQLDDQEYALRTAGALMGSTGVITLGMFHGAAALAECEADRVRRNLGALYCEKAQ